MRSALMIRYQRSTMGIYGYCADVCCAYSGRLLRVTATRVAANSFISTAIMGERSRYNLIIPSHSRLLTCRLAFDRVGFIDK